MPTHLFHMNLEVYGGNVTVDGGGAINWRSGKQTALNAVLGAYAVANGAVDVAGFTEVRVGTTNAALLDAGLADLAASLNMPGGLPHILMAHCGYSALGVGEFVGIAIRGDAAVNAWGRVYDSGHPPNAINEVLGLVGGIPYGVVNGNAPPGATLDRRCVVYADVTLPGGGAALRVGFIHNLYVLRDNLYVILGRLPVLMNRALLAYAGGDFNAPPRNIRSQRAVARLYALAPPVATSAGGNTYDWWARTMPFPAATIHYTALNLAASDHRGVGIIF